MPAPGDNVVLDGCTTQDAMLSRMRAATIWEDRPHVPRWLEAEPPPALLAPLGSVKPAAPGAVLDALSDEITDRITWTLLPFTNIVAAGSVTPDHQWRAAEHFRPFFAIGALREVVEQIVRERVAETVSALKKQEKTHDGTR